MGDVISLIPVRVYTIEPQQAERIRAAVSSGLLDVF